MFLWKYFWDTLTGKNSERKCPTNPDLDLGRGGGHQEDQRQRPGQQAERRQRRRHQLNIHGDNFDEDYRIRALTYSDANPDKM